jgi:hypothetical protein
MSTAKKQIGIWMNYSGAHLLTCSSTHNDPQQLDELTAAQHATQGLGVESYITNRWENHHAAYYRQLTHAIKGYDEVLLFGPTDAKSELLTFLKADKAFADVSINVQPSNEMSEEERSAFVNAYFSGHDAKTPGRS